MGDSEGPRSDGETQPDQTPPPLAQPPQDEPQLVLALRCKVLDDGQANWFVEIADGLPFVDALAMCERLRTELLLNHVQEQLPTMLQRIALQQLAAGRIVPPNAPPSALADLLQRGRRG